MGQLDRAGPAWRCHHATEGYVCLLTSGELPPVAGARRVVWAGTLPEQTMGIPGHVRAARVDLAVARPG